MNNHPTKWAVTPAAWFNFDPDGAVYCVDIETAYRIAGDQMKHEGDQMIWKMTTGKPIKWVRVYADEQISAVTDQHLAHLK